jgi:hypothetical protein
VAPVQYQQTWGEHRVYYRDPQGQLASLPVGWTSLALLDPFVALSAGRSLFRVADLCQRLLGEREEAPGGPA